VNDYNRRAAELLARIRDRRPLVHQITNFVVMTDTANVTLHIGALPVMAHAPEEVEDMVRISSALVLNYGTLAHDWVEAMLKAGRQANASGIPIVLDPVGAGATGYRTSTGLRLLGELRIDIVRANAGEVGALSGAGGEVKGVESVGAGADQVSLARSAAKAWGNVVAVTGKQDAVSDGERVLTVDNGHPWLSARTGTGCGATSVTAAFAAVEPDYVVAAASALAVYGLAAELAARRTNGPASFHTAFFDEIYNLTPEQVESGARIQEA
jgi:hydroxyethylthiazole kinase